MPGPIIASGLRVCPRPIDTKSTDSPPSADSEPKRKLSTAKKVIHGLVVLIAESKRPTTIAYSAEALAWLCPTLPSL